MAFESELKIDVLRAYDLLVESLYKLKKSLNYDENLIAWIQDIPQLKSTTSKTLTTRDKTFNFINQLEYLNQQEPREILIAPGFIGASEQTLESVNELNNKKQEFKSAMLTLKAKKININDPFLTKKFEPLLKQRAPHTSSALNKMGLCRLHLKQCYRKIPILPVAPIRICWTWAHTRSIKKVSKQNARAMLIKRGKDAGILTQLAKLDSLPTNEPLAIVQELAPHLRTNIVLENSKRIMLNGPMPIFFPATINTPMPIFKPPSNKKQKDEQRSQRQDVKINSEVFLPAIRAHRYIEFE